MNSCRAIHETCTETPQDVYLSCTGGSSGCVRVKSYSGVGEKTVSACRNETYMFFDEPVDPNNQNGGVMTVIKQVSVCITESATQADNLGHTILEGECNKSPQTRLVSFPEGGEAFFITYTPC